MAAGSGPTIETVKRSALPKRSWVSFRAWTVSEPLGSRDSRFPSTLIRAETTALATAARTTSNAIFPEFRETAWIQVDQRNRYGGSSKQEPCGRRVPGTAGGESEALLLWEGRIGRQF